MKSAPPVHVGAVVNAMNPHRLGILVDPVQDAIWAASRTELSREVTAEWFADPARFSAQVAVGEFNDGRKDPTR